VGTILAAILAVESVALLFLFPKFKQRMLQRKEFRKRFLRSVNRPRPVPSPHPRQPSARANRLLISRDTPLIADIRKQNPETAITAVKNYMAFDTRDEAVAIYDQARNGNAVAQFIVGIALQRSGYPGANSWLRLSAQQNFGPAQDHLGAEAG
jgi:hypothetical protein